MAKTIDPFLGSAVYWSTILVGNQLDPGAERLLLLIERDLAGRELDRLARSVPTASIGYDGMVNSVLDAQLAARAARSMICWQPAQLAAIDFSAAIHPILIDLAKHRFRPFWRLQMLQPKLDVDQAVHLHVALQLRSVQRRQIDRSADAERLDYVARQRLAHWFVVQHPGRSTALFHRAG